MIGVTIPVYERSAEPRTASPHAGILPRAARRLAVVLIAVAGSAAAAPATPAASATPAAPAAAPAAAAVPAPTPGPAPAAAPKSSAPSPLAGTAAGERCSGCHAQLTQRQIVHGALTRNECAACHRPSAEKGKCQAKTASHWVLVRTEPELCYGCHARKDQSKAVHTAVRQGSCLSCHEAHASNYAGLVNDSREKLCFACHEAEPATKAVRHAPAAEGRCLDCHDPHGGNLPNAIKAESGIAFCQRCHDAKAPTGKGTPGPAYRIDLSKPVVHAALKRTDCLGCHEGGHAGENLKLLKKSAIELCYGCHERKDRSRYPHGAVLVGDCVVCHDPHSSTAPKLLRKATAQETCFLCHQDDLTGRKVVHAPVKKGCDQCHDPHGGPNRFGLKAQGKEACYKCHKPVDAGKVKHAALERYGCTGCHDPHGTANGALLPKRVNDLCATCHERERDGRHVTAIVASGHPVGGNLKDPRRPGHELSCASCHDPHGSDNPVLFYFGASSMEMCDGCHGDKSGKHPELKNLVSRARPQGLAPTGAGSGGPAPGAGGDGAGVAP